MRDQIRYTPSPKLQRLALIALALDNSALRFIQRAAEAPFFDERERATLLRYYRRTRDARRLLAAFADSLGLSRLARFTATVRLEMKLLLSPAPSLPNKPFPRASRDGQAQAALSRLDAFSLFRCQRAYAAVEREAKRSRMPDRGAGIAVARKIESEAWNEAYRALVKARAQTLPNAFRAAERRRHRLETARQRVPSA